MKIKWYTDPLFYGAMVLGFMAWILPHGSGKPPGIWKIVISALAEEIAFRGLILEWLGRLVQKVFGPISLANLLTSLLFVLSHLLYHPLPWAIATFFPSLIFGILWERYKTIIPCWACHCFYNLLFFY